MLNKNENLRNRARVLFTKNERERKNVNKEYQHALELKGDPVKGKSRISAKLCHMPPGERKNWSGHWPGSWHHT